MQKVSLISLMLMAAGMFLFLGGCRKDEGIVSEKERIYKEFFSRTFFSANNKHYKGKPKTQSRTKQSIETEFLDFLYKDSNLVYSLYNRLGYPIWTHAIIDNESEQPVMLIPFARLDDDKVKNYMHIAKDLQTGKLLYHITNRNHLLSYPKKESLDKNSKGKYDKLYQEYVISIIMVFDSEIFSYTDCSFTPIINPVNNDIVETRDNLCWLITYTETCWQIYVGGIYSYSDCTGTIEYTQITCAGSGGDGGFPTGGGGYFTDYYIEGNNSNIIIDPSINAIIKDDRETKLDNCRLANPSLLGLVNKLKQNVVFHPCRNREVFIDINGIEKKLCESGNYDAGSLLTEYNNAVGSSNIIVSDPNSDNAKLLGFFNSGLQLNGCDGKAIDKEQIRRNLCQNGKMNLGGLNEELGKFISSEINSGNPTLSVHKSICPEILKVTPHESKPGTFVTGISNLQFSFDIPNSNSPLFFNVANLHFQNSATNCQYSFSTAVANAINSAIATFQAKIDGGEKLNKLDLLIEIHRAYDKELEHCTPHHGSTVGVVSFLSCGSPNSGGAEYISLNEGDCP